MTRTQARELLMQIVFQMEAQTDKSHELMGIFLRDYQLTGKERGYIETAFDLIVEHLDEIDEQINSHSDRWTVSRMPKADLAILRVAIGEALYVDDVPSAVAINEAVKLAKKFGGDNTPKFINGILGKIING